MSEVKKSKTQMFFHDLVNQTHGLLLFLSNKNSLDSADIESLKAEIKLLQGLIQDHYQFNHRNLEISENDENNQQKIVQALTKLISIYFPQKENLFQISLSGTSEGEVDFIVLYRILNNIVKNMAEAHVFEAKIYLEFSSEGLTFTSENPIGDQNTKDKSGGIGLLSIATLVSEAKGLFQYEIHNSSWKNLIFLPYQTSRAIKKIAA